MKKFGLIAALLLTLVACGEDKSDSSSASDEDLQSFAAEQGFKSYEAFQRFEAAPMHVAIVVSRDKIQFQYPGQDGVLGQLDRESTWGSGPILFDEKDAKALDDFFSDELVLPAGTKIGIRSTSRDIIHTVEGLPGIGAIDAVPGMWVNTLYTSPDDPIEVELICNEDHEIERFRHRTALRVIPATEFADWSKKNTPTEIATPTWEQGKTVYHAKGCNACHSIDGTINTGPTWKGMWGATHDFSNAEPTVVDEVYIRESILFPAKKIREGYPNQMPDYTGNIADSEIEAIVAFIKHLGEK